MPMLVLVAFDVYFSVIEAFWGWIWVFFFGVFVFPRKINQNLGETGEREKGEGNFFMLSVDLATTCYEHACGKFPNNLELMMGLFNCYVREYSFVKQQQTAIKMYKIVGEERFLLWAVCSIQLQGRLLARAGDYAAAANIFQKVLELCPDDWECFLHYLGCLLEDNSSWCSGTITDPIHPPKCVNCKFSHLTDEVFDSRISDASAFVQKLQVEANSDCVRCPYLANLEIERRKHLFGKGDEDKLMEALMQYFLRFGHLACFTSDVEVFLQVLTLDKKAELLEKLMKSCDSDSLSTVPTKVLGQSITLFKLSSRIDRQRVQAFCGWCDSYLFILDLCIFLLLPLVTLVLC